MNDIKNDLQGIIDSSDTVLSKFAKNISGAITGNMTESERLEILSDTKDELQILDDVSDIVTLEKLQSIVAYIIPNIKTIVGIL